MDAPPIQYARTDDGVSIAYWVMGTGPPLIHEMLPAASHLELEWAVTSLRTWYERLTERFTVVRFDHRACGMSDHDLSDLSLDAYLRDVDAVVGATGLDDFTLLGTRHMGPVSIAYAVANPDRVSHLALLNTWANGSDPSVRTGLEASRALSKIDSGVWAENVARFAAGRRDPEPALLDLFQTTVDPGSRPAMLEAFAQLDVTDQLSQVRTPCLVLHASDRATHPINLAITLAAGIQGATLVTLDAAGDPFLTGEAGDRLLEVLVDFVGLDQKVSSTTRADGPFRTILFTDLESSTALTQAIGDAKAQDILHGHNDVVRAALAAHDGEEVKHTGDGIMASFGSAVAAVEAALAIQSGLAGGEIRVRVGLNAGEPIHEAGDYFGGSVQLAARVCDRAEPGQVLVSNVVRELCTGKLFQFVDQGEATLKGFPEPIRLYTVTPPGGDN
jgi:class 3 adenylate cyclase